MTQPPLPRAFFLPAPQGQRFALFHTPAPGTPARGRVLYLPPFAEELNTTRRVVAQQARALAGAGYAVLQVDLHGCGDSEGEFAEATWATWLEDARAARAWLREHAPPHGAEWLWGLRSGALLAGELVAAGSSDTAAHLLLWQPVASGQQMLRQFLRLHAASQWLADGGGEAPAPSTSRSAAQTLAADGSVDIAGYRLGTGLADGLDAARLHAPSGMPQPSRLVWLEASPPPEPRPSPAAETQAAAWRAAGWQVHLQAVQAPAFWQTVGTSDAPALIDATLAALNGQNTIPAPQESSP